MAASVAVLLSAVTPFVGVWIETGERLVRYRQVAVTPFVGVWIETRQRRMRRMPLTVTPFVGVWIETFQVKMSLAYGFLHPSWVCGLKQTGDSSNADVSSHTLRGCVD